MVRSAAVIVLLIFATRAHIDRINDERGYIDLADDLVDNLANNLLNQDSSTYHAGLANLTLGQPSNQAKFAQASLTPFNFQFSPFFPRTRSVSPWVGRRPGFRNEATLDQRHGFCNLDSAVRAGVFKSSPLIEGVVALDPLQDTSFRISATGGTEVSKPKPVRTQRILSGVQPTGTIHLGNYLGAVRQWVDMQNTIETDNETGLAIPKINFFCVVDLHAITMPHDPAELRESTLMTAALYLASGIDPSQSKVFVQSHVSAHSELAWLLTCATPMGWLERMIQFKEKARKQGESVGTGLFTYPVLMAADILLYQADRVPVGEDQRQHLELARNIAERFNTMYCKGNPYKKRCKKAGVPSRPVFLEPQANIVKEGARVMSLQDGTSKMSKSDANDASRINVLDSPAEIRNKIKRCKTDSELGLEWDNPKRPEATNLLNIYLAVQPGRTREDILDEVKDMTWGDFKSLLAEAVVAHLEPIQKRYAEIRANETYLNSVLKDGADAANEVASRTLHAAKVAMGFAAPAE